MGFDVNNSKTRMKIIGSILFLWWAAMASAGTLSLKVGDAVALGLERSVVLQNARREAEIAETKIGEIRAQIFPELKARGGYTRYDELTEINLAGGSTTLGRLDTYSASAEAKQLLYDGGSVRAGLRAAKSYRKGIACETERLAADITWMIRSRFYAAMLAQQGLEVQQETQRYLEKLRDQAQDRLARQAVSEFEVLTARARVDSGRADLLAARAGVQRAESELGRTLALQTDETLALEGDWPALEEPADLKILQAWGRQQRPEMRKADADVALAEARVRVEQGSYAPELRAVASYNGQNPPDLFSSDNEWDWRWQAGLTLEWSFLDGGRRAHLVRARRLELAQVRALRSDVQRDILLEVEQAWLDVNIANEVCAATDSAVALSERSLEIAGERYRQGLSTYLEFMDANLALRTARLSRCRALHGAAVAWARLERACGGADPSKMRREHKL